MSDPTRGPVKWYFYNLKQSIDDPQKAFTAAGLDSLTSTFGDPVAPACPAPPVPQYSTSTLRKTIYPVVEWIPFSPSDNARLIAAGPQDEPVAVGHDRLMFQVEGLTALRPIYWPLPYSTKVSSCHWCFASTLTPIDPAWDEKIMMHYQNYLANLDTYRSTLEKAETEPALVRVIAPRVQVTQAGREMILDVVFSPKNHNVYLFKASAALCSAATASALLQGQDPRGAAAILRPFDFADYKKMYSVPDRPSDIPTFIPLPVNRLILVFHGIGQKLSDNYSRINFAYAIDKLRVAVAQAAESPDIYKHFPGHTNTSVRYLVLPVNWRFAMNSDVDFNLETVTVQSMLSVRQAVGDALLDIPLYMSENWRPRMLAAAAKEANRLYAAVLRQFPSFKQHGKTSVLGHSLGSLITADLLTHQPSVLTPHTEPEAPLKFQTDNYFLTGSMLGLFMLLKREQLRPRSEFDKIHPGIAGKDRPFGCFAVRNLYNIINQSDVLCFLINSTVEGAMDAGALGLVGDSGLALEADDLPKARAGSSSPKLDAPPSPPGANSRRSSLGRFFSTQISRARGVQVEDAENEAKPTPEIETPDQVKEVLERFRALNENGQLDWKIPAPVSYFSSQYLKMFTAHFDYWSDPDLAQFLAVECGREPGVDHALKEHKTKWTFKPDASQPNPGPTAPPLD